MFVEKLSSEKIQKIIEKVVPKSCYEIEANLVVDENPSIELIIKDRIFRKYRMYLFDTYLYSDILLNEIQQKNRQFIKELYAIFGEEYKKFYLEQVNKIFEKQK